MVADKIKYLQALGRWRATLSEYREALVGAPSVLLDRLLEFGCGSLGVAGLNADFHHELDEGWQLAEPPQL